MTHIKKTILTSAVIIALGTGASAQAALVAADAMTITGGSFAMGLFTPFGPIPFVAVSGPTVDIAGEYHPPGWNVNNVQIGSGAGSLAAFAFGSAWVNTFTAAASSQPGIVGGGPVPSGTFDNAGGTTTFDISSFFVNWSGVDVGQGNSAASLATSNCSATGCDYTLSWQALVVDGAFRGNTGTWVLTGTVSAVPVPAAVWLLGSGLVGLVGAVRRRKART